MRNRADGARTAVTAARQAHAEPDDVRTLTAVIETPAERPGRLRL